MGNAWDEKRKAAEESYFDKQNKQAMEKLARRVASESRKSPITGKPMTQRVVDGITIDVCADSGGVWLDAGELEALIQAAIEKAKNKDHSSGSWLASVLGIGQK